MKFIRLLIAVHILMTGSALWADGLRFTADKKGLEEEHVTLKLTPEQVTQVEQFREVILMPKQQAELQKIQPKAPKSLSVLTSRVETCLCEMPIIGVWCRPGEIDIPLFLMKRAANMAESSTDAKLEPASSIPKRLPDGASIIFDSEGRMYYEGLKIELKDLVDRLARGLEPTEYTHADEPMSIFVNPPPPINPKVDKAVVETIKTILKACKKHKIGCYGETMHLDESE